MGEESDLANQAQPEAKCGVGLNEGGRLPAPQGS
jgi:hypothetical protein